MHGGHYLFIWSEGRNLVRRLFLLNQVFRYPIPSAFDVLSR